MDVQMKYSISQFGVQWIKCFNEVDVLMTFLATLEGQNFFPVFDEHGKIKTSSIPKEATFYQVAAERLLTQGKQFIAKLVQSKYAVEQHDAIIVSHDEDPLWYLHSLIWAFVTKRAWIDQREVEKLTDSRRLYVGSPNVPSDSLVGYSKHVTHYLTGANPSVLNHLLIKTIDYQPEENEDDVIFRVEAQTTTFAKTYPELCEPATVLNVRMKKGAHTLFINGHSGDDFLITDSMVLCGKQSQASYEVLPNREIAPVCFNTGKCFTDVLPSWINRKSYVRMTETLPFKHVVLYGCRSFYLGYNPYGPYFDLALGAVSGQTVSYIGSFENVDTELEQVFFLNVLLRSGYTISEALDLYNEWAEHSFQGRAPLRAVGDPQIRHFEEKEVPHIHLAQTNTIHLNQPCWAFKVVVDGILPTTTAIDVQRLGGGDEEIHFATIQRESATDIWVFRPLKLKSGTYLIRLIDVLDVDRLDIKMTNLHYRLNILEHLQILENESRKGVKSLREHMSQIIQMIPSLPQQANGQQFQTMIETFLGNLNDVQSSILVPLINNLDNDIANPLMLYDKRRIYGKETLCECPVCGHTMTLSELHFPGIPRSERMREQCVNCEMMLERPRDSKTYISATLVENLDKSIVTVTLTNNSDEPVHASLGSVIEMGAHWGSQLTPKYINVTLKPNQIMTKEIVIQSQMIPPVPRQYMFMLGLIDMEWFYYSVGLLPRKEYTEEKTGEIS